MVKPTLPYLDVLADAATLAPDHPLACYQVSGEFAMIVAGARAGVYELRAMAFESVNSMLRAGARGACAGARLGLTCAQVRRSSLRTLRRTSWIGWTSERRVGGRVRESVLYEHAPHKPMLRLWAIAVCSTRRAPAVRVTSSSALFFRHHRLGLHRRSRVLAHIISSTAVSTAFTPPVFPPDPPNTSHVPPAHP
jgi:hypothetical protein